MRLAILGASGHGKVVADAAGLVGWDEVVFFDDAWPLLCLKVLRGSMALLLPLDITGFARSSSVSWRLRGGGWCLLFTPLR
jgi:hypothetical protein